MFEIVDGTFRAYKKKQGNIALHLRTHLLVHTNARFSLGAYLKDVKGWIRLPEKKEIEIDIILFSEAIVCEYANDIMVHDFMMSVVLKEKTIIECVADLRVMFHLSFTGHSSEEPVYIKKKVFVVPRF